MASKFWQNFKVGPLRVCLIGSGNWGSAIATILGRNCKDYFPFVDEVKMYVHDELHEGKMISKWINEDHKNPKYLPGKNIPENILACTNILDTAADADLLVFVVPHQFVVGICKTLAGHVKQTAQAISLVKGLHIDNGFPHLITDLVTQNLGIPCCVLSGANVATGVANGEFSETTIGYLEKEIANVWQLLFDTPTFRVNAVPDVRGVDLCGAAKNAVALAAGFCDGLGLGSNSKAAIMRIGIEEIKTFACIFFDGILTETFFDSAGVADVVTTCFGGRNVRAAAEFIKRHQKDSWEKIEQDMIGGQKLQGPMTCKEIFAVINHHSLESVFPLLTTTYQVAFEKMPPKMIVEVFMSTELRPITKREECHAMLISESVLKARKRLQEERNPTEKVLIPPSRYGRTPSPLPQN